MPNADTFETAAAPPSQAPTDQAPDLSHAVVIPYNARIALGLPAMHLLMTAVLYLQHKAFWPFLAVGWALLAAMQIIFLVQHRTCRYTVPAAPSPLTSEKAS